MRDFRNPETLEGSEKMNPLVSKQLLSQYACKSVGFQIYTLLRTLLCPYDRVAAYVPNCGSLLDVGCGFGLWLTYLALSRREVDLHGVDVDHRKLAIARTSTNNGIRFHDANCFEWQPNSFDCVTIVDVMYLLDNGAKRRLLKDILVALRPGGMLLLKELDTHPVWKYALSWMQEALAVNLFRITSGAGIYFLAIEEYGRLMEEVGFASVDIKRIDVGYPHPSVLVMGKKTIE